MASQSLVQLDRRAVVALAGPDWRDFLQNLITQDVGDLTVGEIRFGALLTPQGRLLYDLFLHGREDGCLIDCEAAHREALIGRLTMYRLRAKVTIAPDEAPVLALWGGKSAPEGWGRDPRLPELGWRAIGAPPPDGVTRVDSAAYEAHRLALGVPGSEDYGSEKTYPIEADFDLLAGIDFRKGCYVGQETTSRMKRRGQIRNRMVPIAFEGEPPPFGTELLAGELRAGEALGVHGDRAMALLRLDRLEAGPLTFADGQPWRPLWPDWLPREG
ncbi:MAG TPA: folate-binding protein [Caulobacteraceae bacterium]